MINKEFKEQFAPTFSKQMHQIGFTGTGHQYTMSTQTFLFAVELEINKHNQINLFFGIQPTAILTMADYKAQNVKNIGPQSCELTIQLTKLSKKPFWNVGINKQENEKEAHDVFTFIQKNVVPIIAKYITNPYLLDKIEPSDLNDKNIMFQKLYGMHPVGMPSRTAWMLAIYHEDKDLARSKAFARYGLESLGLPTVEITSEIKKMLDCDCVSGNVFGGDYSQDDTFFGIPDLKRVDKK
ncbi:hypothetical protein ACR79B_07270 [Sphingobacterium spiritivorum]|uniref:hypothetical protein n=1 Tax=Sphingobacterium spiritivorum TaxID=258 RepID=UPI003DA543B5